MSKVLVTHVTNVIRDDTTGEFAIKDRNWVGWLTATFPLTTQIVNPETNQVELGTVFKCSVFWEHARSPSPSFEDPSDLFWLDIEGTDDGDEEDDDDEEGLIDVESRDV